MNRTDLVNASLVVKNETLTNANTASRVGTLFENISNSFALGFSEVKVFTVPTDFATFEEAIAYLNLFNLSETGGTYVELYLPAGTQTFSGSLYFSNINYPLYIYGDASVTTIVGSAVFLENSTVFCYDIYFDSNFITIDSFLSFNRCRSNDLTMGNSVFRSFSTSQFKRVVVDQRSRFLSTTLVTSEAIVALNGSDVDIQTLTIDAGGVSVTPVLIARSNSCIVANDVDVVNNLASPLVELSYNSQIVTTTTKVGGVASNYLSQVNIFDGSNYYNSVANVKEITALSYTLTAADHNKYLLFTNIAALFAVNINYLFDGFACTILYTGPFSLQFVPIGHTMVGNVVLPAPYGYGSIVQIANKTYLRV